jgi:transcriptional regulator GlxA family with amidase domain
LSALISDVPFLNCADTDTTGFAVSQVTPRLLDSWSNLLGLLDFPEDIPVLTPLMEAELLYRVLKGPQNYVVRRFALTDPRHDQIRKAIDWIKAHYDQPFSASELANMAGMSTASFHRHFKAATALSPLQYQKSIRLQEARRLLVSNTNASLVAYTVGYESASQFSREYARLFGSPPARHAKRLRETDRDPGA